MLKLRSPSTAELQNLKIYTPSEIENGKGREPEYRRFWNDKVKNLAKEKMCSKEICKRVNDLWNLHRCKLLQMETEELQKKAKDVEKEQPDSSFSDSPREESKMKKITLPRNIIQCIYEASKSVESLDGEVRPLERSLKRSHDMVQLKIKNSRKFKESKSSLGFCKNRTKKSSGHFKKKFRSKKVGTREIPLA